MRGSGIAPSPSPSHTLCTPFPASTSNSQAVYKRLYNLSSSQALHNTNHCTSLVPRPCTFVVLQATNTQGLGTRLQLYCKVRRVGRWPGNEANTLIMGPLLFLQALKKKIGLSDQMGKFFGLFQRMEHDFGKYCTVGILSLSRTQAVKSCVDGAN